MKKEKEKINKMQNKEKNFKQGFTLPELLVVVIIIGTLAVIALPKYQMAVGKAKFATLKDNARIIKDAMDRYYLANNSFTTNLEALDVELKGNLTSDKHYVDLADGSHCYIGAEIFCSRKIFDINMEYSIDYVSYDKNKKFCYAKSLILTDKPNRLCQQETNKTTYTKIGNYNRYKY